MTNLCSWDWGCKALLSNSKAKKYILERIPKPQEICKVRFELIQKASAMASKIPGLLDASTVEELLMYQ
jgi:hypothetical protein